MSAQPNPGATDRYFEARRREDRLSSWVCFPVGTQTYGLPIGCVQEVLSGVAVEAVPGTAAVVVGVINLRGSVVTVLDLRLCLDRQDEAGGRRDADRRYCIVVLDLGGELFGVCVDGVAEVIKLPGAAIKPAPRVGDGDNSARTLGVVSRNDRLLTLLDADSLVEGLRFLAP
ncbi:MAG TPA: chemotaxis protein CheW [Fontimonas sp.]